MRFSKKTRLTLVSLIGTVLLGTSSLVFAGLLDGVKPPKPGEMPEVPQPPELPDLPELPSFEGKMPKPGKSAVPQVSCLQQGKMDMTRHQASGRVVHDVRTPNDIATYTYDGVMGNHYLAARTGQPHTLLPGSAMPDLLKTALLASKLGTLPAAALMGKEHTMGALVNGQQGLSVGPDGRYRIPEGQRDFSEIPAQARARFAMLSSSPVTKVGQMASADDSSPWNRHQIQREDGSRQWLSSNAQTGAVEIENFGADGRRSRIELNPRRGKDAVFTELDAQGRPVRSETVAMCEPEVSSTQLACAERFIDQLGPRLAQLGMNETQIDTLAAAAAKESTRHSGQGEVTQFLLNKDGSSIAMKQEQAPIREFSVADALAKHPAEHWREAVVLGGPPYLAVAGTAQEPSPERQAHALS